MRKENKERRVDRPSREETAAFYERYASKVYKICLGFLKEPNDAADAMQDTFLKWLDTENRPQGEAHEIAWLAVTAGNLCRDRLRRRQRFPEAGLDEAYGIGCEEKGFRRTELLDAVFSLPEKYKTVIYLFYYEDMTTAQISEATGIRQKTVTSLLTRGRRLLKKRLETGGDKNG